MDVRMPDGTLVRDVPEGVTQAELLRRYQQHKATPADQPPMELPTKSIARQEAAKYAGSLLPASGNVADMNPVMQGLGGAKAAWDQAALGVKGLFTNLSPAEREQLVQGRSFIDSTGAGSTIGKFAGDIAMTAAPSVRGAQLVGWGARMLPRALQGAARVGGTVGTDAAIGAAVSPENRTAGAIGGAAGSVIGQGGQGLASGLVAPWVQPAARELMDRGVQPTVGQAVGGALNTAEQKFTALPLIGGAIRRARNRANDEYVREATLGTLPQNRRAPLPDGGIGDRAVLETGDRIHGMYDEAFNNFPPQFTVDHGDVANMAAVAALRPDRVLSQQGQQRVLDAVHGIILNKPATLTPEAAKQIESELNAAVRNTINSSVAEDRVVGQALLDVRNAWHESLTGIGNSNGGVGGTMLRDADNSYRAFLPVDRAASSTVAQNAAVTSEAGRFSPRLMRRAIEAVDTSMNNRQSRRVAAGVDRYERPPGAPGEPPEPTITRGEQTPWGTTPPGTDIVPAGGGFDYTARAALPPPGGQLGPVRPGGVGPAAAQTGGGGQLGPVRAGAAEGPVGAAAGGYRPQGMNLPETPPGARFDENNRLTRFAEEVIPDYYPDSGTAGRLLSGGVGAAAVYGAGPIAWVGYPLLAAAAALGGTRSGQRILTQGMSPAAQRLAGYMRAPLFGAGVDVGQNLGAPTPEEDAKLLRQLGLVQY